MGTNGTDEMDVTLATPSGYILLHSARGVLPGSSARPFERRPTRGDTHLGAEISRHIQAGLLPGGVKAKAAETRNGSDYRHLQRLARSESRLATGLRPPRVGCTKGYPI